MYTVFFITLNIDKINQLEILLIDLDEIKFGLVMINLFGNVFKFTARGGSNSMSFMHLKRNKE